MKIILSTMKVNYVEHELDDGSVLKTAYEVDENGEEYYDTAFAYEFNRHEGWKAL